MNEAHFHVVCTRDEARKIIDNHKKYWVSNCGCRESGPGCNRSRMDVCLFFDTHMGGTGSNFKEVDNTFVEGILQEAETTHLVTRPFRYEDDKTRIQGICFCCDDCCYYFTESQNQCDKGVLIEQTDINSCEQCGQCVTVCYFGARKIFDDTLEINQENCYGCGLCTDVCPAECIQMVKR
ncbi:MAG: 4Fe-4S binding protein [Candidatus Methanofastidiosia archaeon]|jgi:Pyruvate/2-oxoacid:ferredoxin oxidoreductase delta subunit